MRRCQASGGTTRRGLRPAARREHRRARLRRLRDRTARSRRMSRPVQRHLHRVLAVGHRRARVLQGLAHVAEGHGRQARPVPHRGVRPQRLRHVHRQRDRDVRALRLGADTVEWLTPAVLEMYRARGWDSTPVGTEAVDADDRALMALEPTLNITDAEVAETLHKLPRNGLRRMGARRHGRAPSDGRQRRGVSRSGTAGRRARATTAAKTTAASAG
jgi:hypothetical protein